VRRRLFCRHAILLNSGGRRKPVVCLRN
jgi:hypothetical protein